MEVNKDERQEVGIDQYYISFKLYKSFPECLASTPGEGFFIGGIRLVNGYWDHNSKELTLYKEQHCYEILPAVHVEITKEAIQECDDKSYTISCIESAN